MAGKLRVTRRAHSRRGFTKRTGTRISATKVKKSKSFLIKDRGRPGRGPKIIPELKKGTLGGPGFFKKSASERRRIESRIARKKGEKAVVGKLRAVQVFSKRTNPAVSEKARADSRYIAGSFIGKKQVQPGTGFSRFKKRQ